MELTQIPLTNTLHLSTVSPGKSENLEELLKSSSGGIKLFPDGRTRFITPDQAQYTLTELSEGVEGVIDLIISRSLSYLFVFDENACHSSQTLNDNATQLLTRIGYTSRQQLSGYVLVIPIHLFF